MKLLLSIFLTSFVLSSSKACPEAYMQKIFPISVINGELHTLQLNIHRSGIIPPRVISPKTQTDTLPGEFNPFNEEKIYTFINVIAYYCVFSQENKIISQIKLDSTYIKEGKIHDISLPILKKLIDKIKMEYPGVRMLTPISIDHCNFEWNCSKVKFTVDPNLNILYKNSNNEQAKTKINARKVTIFHHDFDENDQLYLQDTSSLLSFYTNTIRKYSDGTNTIEVVYINQGEIFKDFDDEGNEKKINYNYNKEINPLYFKKSIYNTIYIDFILHHNNGTDLVFWF